MIVTVFRSRLFGCRLDIALRLGLRFGVFLVLSIVARVVAVLVARVVSHGHLTHFLELVNLANDRTIFACKLFDDLDRLLHEDCDHPLHLKLVESVMFERDFLAELFAVLLAGDADCVSGVVFVVGPEDALGDWNGLPFLDQHEVDVFLDQLQVVLLEHLLFAVDPLGLVLVLLRHNGVLGVAARETLRTHDLVRLVGVLHGVQQGLGLADQALHLFGFNLVEHVALLQNYEVDFLEEPVVTFVGEVVEVDRFA